MSGTHTEISNKISMLFGSEISLKDFSFSQLIVAVKNLFDTEGVPGFVKALVMLIESLLIKSETALYVWALELMTHKVLIVGPSPIFKTFGFWTVSFDKVRLFRRGKIWSTNFL